MTTISVALCTFNGERYIARQLASILEQDVLPDEVVVADDGSNDATLELIRAQFEESDTPVSLTILDRGAIDGGTSPLGVTANFARAIAACSGELIVLCDQDDVWHPDRLAVQAASFAVAPDLLLQHSDASLVDADGEALGTTLFEGLTVSAGERAAIAGGDAFSTYLRRNLATGATIMFRRELMEAASPIPLVWVHDEWLAVIAAATGRVGLHEEALIDYRQHGANQIGVQKPTLRYRLGRMLEPRGERNVRLADRSDVLLARLEELGADSVVVHAAAEKARFERVRAGLPRLRLARLSTVWREFRAGSYRRYASQGDLDVARDILQPA